MSLDFFFYSDAPGPDTLWDLLLNAGSHEDSPPQVFAGLLTAWWALVESGEEEIESLSFEEAQIVYQKAYVKAYNSDKTLRNYDESDGVWWPESMPCKGWFPKKVVIRIAQICASKEIASIKTTHWYLQQHYPDQYPPEKFVVREGA